MSLVRGILLVVALSGLTILAGCPESPKGRIGDPCGSGSECEEGLCYDGHCLDPWDDPDHDNLANQPEVNAGTDPFDPDTDHDGENDRDEVGMGAEPLDGDDDGIIDALESQVISEDSDRDMDCLPDEYDPRNGTFDDDENLLVQKFCLLKGVCGAAMERVSAACDSAKAGQEDAVVCDYATVPGFEEEESSCDAADNDCDGETDEGLNAVPATVASCPLAGVCGLATGEVDADCVDGVWQCHYEGVPDYEPETEESCDGLDNDCDGHSDEDFVDKDVPVGGDCHGYGECAVFEGVVECGAPDAAVCSVDAGGSDEQGTGELCDGLDNDCDGETDEDFFLDDSLAIGEICSGMGVCSQYQGVVECSPTGDIICSVNAGGSNGRGQTEVCDGLDNDCDGRTDIDPELPPGEPSPCPSRGVCAGAAIVVCDDEQNIVCDFDAVEGWQTEEVACDGFDNDCDGLIDEFLPMDFDGQIPLIAQTGPPDRSGFAAAVDEERAMLVLVGGLTASWNPFLVEVPNMVDTWELELETGEWTRISNDMGEHPPARFDAQLVYDSAEGRMLLLGGYAFTTSGIGLSSWHDDLWAYDLETHTWSELARSGMPGRPAASAVLASRPGGSRELWLVGGQPLAFGMKDEVSSPYDGLARIELGGSVVAESYPGSLELRAYPAAAYDPDADRIVLFGGEKASGATSELVYVDLDDVGVSGTIVCELDSFSQALTPQSRGGMVFDEETGRFWHVGVSMGVDGLLPATYLIDVPSRNDPSRCGASFLPPASDAPRGYFASPILSGHEGEVEIWMGQDPDTGLLRREIWSASTAVSEDNTWAMVWEDPSPAPRSFAASAAEPKGELPWFVYGGLSQGFSGWLPRFDLWSFDFVDRTWTAHRPMSDTVPWPTLFASTGVLLPGIGDAGTFYLLGGGYLTGSSVDDVTAADEMWAFDIASATWNFVTVPSALGGPARMLGHAACAAPDGTIWIYGGYDEPGDATNQLWSVDPSGAVWTAHTPVGTPLPRVGHFMAFDPEGMFLFVVGNGSLGVYDVATNTWTEHAGITRAGDAVTLGAYDPWSKEALVLAVPVETGGLGQWHRIYFGDSTNPQRLDYPGGLLGTGQLLGPSSLDPVSHGMLILGGPDISDRTAGGLWRAPQVCR